ncbi:splicing factor, CC1-like protein [Polyplosphaeria fusca]|uniref:Splicing factor, CC1-like protein n=1 Tax=Polyplosphaeria fusca TaxID=682080 RepID=A0A9P4V8P5_9PLEO|nr:splicing factor, CC1-like protein [Polyplosphaeria fusca]
MAANPDDIERLLDEAAAEQQASAQQSGHRQSRDDDRFGGDRDRNRDRDRDRGYRNYSHRESIDRDRSRDRPRRRRDDSRTRSHEDANTDDDQWRRDRSHVDHYSGGGRARSRSRSPRRQTDRDRRDRSRDRDNRRRDDHRRRRNSGDSPQQPDQDDRDKRTVFVQQITARATIRHLRQFFETVGPVVDAQIVTDRVSGRPKGVGYVEFKDEASVPKAIELTGQKLKGVPVIVQLTEAEKNRASKAQAEGNAVPANGAPFHRLYVGNIHFSVNEDDLRGCFEPYGEIDSIVIQRDEEKNGNRSKGYGFVQFVNPEHAKKALEELNGFSLANRPIRVGLGSDRFTSETTQNLMHKFDHPTNNFQGSAFSGAGGRGAHAGGSGGYYDRTSSKEDRGVGNASALDDNDIGSTLNNINRYKLMSALAREPISEPEAKNRNLAKPTPKTEPSASRCLKIENVFNMAEEYQQNGDNWITQLQDEIKDECDTRYGTVVHLAVDPNSDGDIYVKFKAVDGGLKAWQGLNGRLFNGRQLRASYVVEKIYNSIYPAAARV